MNKNNNRKMTAGSSLRLLALILLAFVGMSTRAAVNIEIQASEGGTVAVASQSDPDDGGNVTVSITVTPAEGYQISRDNIVVEVTVDPETAKTRTDVKVGDQLTLIGDDPEDLTKERPYTFVVPAGFGAIVKAEFQKSDKAPMSGKLGEGDNAEAVTWAVTPATSDEDAPLTLTISGEGATRSLGAEEASPWKTMLGKITQVVVGEGVTAIGDGLLNGLTQLSTIVLKNEEAVVALGSNTLPEGLTADVPGHLYNAYKLNEDWTGVTVASTTGIQMTGTAFGENIHYAGFAPMVAFRIPTVLKAYAATSVAGSTLTLEEITDQIIPTGVPVLLFSETDNVADFIGSAAKSEGTATETVLSVDQTPKTVGIGEVYVLYKDAFYLSQAGTLPAGRIYLEASRLQAAPSSARVAISRAGNTTAISNVATETVEADEWHCLDGRRLSAQPAKKGIYIHNGKKVVIK